MNASFQLNVPAACAGLIYQRPHGRLAAAAVVTLVTWALAGTAAAQTVSGRLAGVVTDAQGAVISGARVELSRDLTKTTREFETAANGGFLFGDVLAGDYTLRIVQPGFK